MQDVEFGQFSISATIKSRANNSEWSLTGVYGPQEEPEKLQFMSEIRGLKPRMQAQWAIIGDFNLIYRQADKSFGRINRRLMNNFKRVLDDLELKELHLQSFMADNIHGLMKRILRLSPK